MGAGSAGERLLPKLAVAPRGRLDAVYLETRGRGPDASVGASLASSYDSGRSWSRVALSGQRFPPKIGPPGVSGGADYGTRLGVVSDDGGAFAVWPDGRRGTEVSGKLDVFFAPVRFSAVGALDDR